MEFSFDGTPLTTLEYTIKSEEYGRAFIAFQKKYVYPKNYVLTGVFVVIMLLYANQLYHDPAYSLAWLLIGMCVLFVGQMWFNTFRTRGKLMTSIKMIADNKYMTLVYENGLQISTLLPEEAAEEAQPAMSNSTANAAADDGSAVNSSAEKKDPYDDDYDDISNDIPPKQIFFERDNPHVINCEDMFIIYLKKQMFYVLPKGELSEADTALLAELFARKTK